MHLLKYFAVLLLACGVLSHSGVHQSLINPDASALGCHKNCRKKTSQCCPRRNPCCCCAEVCTNLDCLQYMRVIPSEPPETAFFNSTGVGPGAPCCGPTCSPDQCLQLIKLQLLAMQDPLTIQRDGLGKYPDDVECCGEGCSTRGCFSNILTNIIQLQSPIQNTQNGTISTMAKEEV